MIQRIQTIYLFLSVLAISAIFFLPLAQIMGYSEEIFLKSTGLYTSGGEKIENALPISILLALEIIFTLVIIFLYKKRNRQMMLGKLNLLILTLLIAVIFFYGDHARSLSGLSNDSLVNYKFACLLPVFSIILNYLAIRAINKDEDLVRASERLR